MKIKGVLFKQNNPVDAKIELDDSDDLWIIYNILDIGDRLGFTDKRTRIGQTKHRVLVQLEIVIDKLSFDGPSCTLRCSGKIVSGVDIGRHHSINLSMEGKTKYRLQKPEFTRLQKQLLKEYIAGNDLTNMNIVIMMKKGTASIYKYNKGAWKHISTIQKSIPKHRKYFSKHDKALAIFQSRLFTELCRNKSFVWHRVSSIVIAGPGIMRRYFIKTLQDYTNCYKTEIAAIKESSDLNTESGFLEFLETPERILTIRIPDISRESLDIILNDENLKLSMEAHNDYNAGTALEKFYEVLNTKPDQCRYGYADTKTAVENNWVKYIVVADRFFKAPNVDVRRRYCELVSMVLTKKIRIFLAQRGQMSEEAVYNLGGFATVLTREVPDYEFSP